MELKISGIKKSYQAYNGEITFSLALTEPLFLSPGEVTFIMGHNGSGKSVLLKLLAGEIAPSTGSVKICQGDNCWEANKFPCAIVRQSAETSLALDLTVQENLIARSRPASFASRLFPVVFLKEYVDNLIKDQKNLVGTLNQPCRFLSGGQKQTLAFISAASRQLPLLFLDEFLSATDQSTSLSLRNLARQYAQSTPASVLVVSHDIETAIKDADRILILRAGYLIKDIIKSDVEWDKDALSALLA